MAIDQRAALAPGGGGGALAEGGGGADPCDALNAPPMACPMAHTRARGGALQASLEAGLRIQGRESAFRGTPKERGYRACIQQCAIALSSQHLQTLNKRRRRMWSRTRTLHYSSCLSLLTILSACGTSIHAPLQPIEVTFSHAGTGPTTIGDVHAANGQHVIIRVTNTNTHCYAFNSSVVSSPLQMMAKAKGQALSANETAEFDLEMRDDPLEVTIEARKQGSDPECNIPGLSDRVTGGQPPPWKVRILREGWDIAFARGYTADTVTNPVFGLVAGQKQIDPAPAAKTAGFFVKTFPEQEDAYRLGAAAMVHVFHTSPTAFSWHDISWTPVSFGLGVG